MIGVGQRAFVSLKMIERAHGNTLGGNTAWRLGSVTETNYDHKPGLRYLIVVPGDCTVAVGDDDFRRGDVLAVKEPNELALPKIVSP
jgi:hypothetical protein